MVVHLHMLHGHTRRGKEIAAVIQEKQVPRGRDQEGVGAAVGSLFESQGAEGVGEEGQAEPPLRLIQGLWR